MRKPRQMIGGGGALRKDLRDKGHKRRDDLAAIGASGPGRLSNDLLPKLELVYRDPNAACQAETQYPRSRSGARSASYEFNHYCRLRRPGPYRPGQQYPRRRYGSRSRQ